VAVDSMMIKEAAYLVIGIYALTKFLSDFCNNFREIIFASVSANCEVYIARRVFKHVQDQGLAFHLNRETGRVIRICSKGSQSFSMILKMLLF
jgi:ABC-type bacteriocin/lantibiotic exporter with double-glycine peptidase domain